MTEARATASVDVSVVNAPVLGVVAPILAASIVPALIFTALSITAVNNVILIGQIDTPLVLALSVLLLGEKVNKWIVGGAILAFIAPQV